MTLKSRTIATRKIVTKTPQTAESSDVKNAESSHLSVDISDVILRTIVTKICPSFSRIIKCAIADISDEILHF